MTQASPGKPGRNSGEKSRELRALPIFLSDVKARRGELTADGLQLTAFGLGRMGRQRHAGAVSREPYTLWDGIDELGKRLPPEAYFTRRDVAGEHVTTRIVLQR